MRKAWDLPLRTWLALAVVALIMTPIVTFIGVIMLIQGPEKTKPTPYEAQSLRLLSEATELLQQRRADWELPAFQKQIRDLLDRAGYSVVLVSGEGLPLYSSHLVKAEVGEGLEITTYGSHHLTGFVWDGAGQVIGIYLIGQRDLDPIYALLLWIAFACLILGSLYFVIRMGRTISEPVLALAQVAQLIKKGQLDFSLPETRVREVNQLAQAFAAMRKGLKQALYQQAALEQERRTLIAAVAHDLRTPLTSVRGYLEGIRDGIGRSPERLDHYVGVALEKTGRLEQMIENLFTYTKTEYLNQPVEPAALDLVELLSEAVESMRPQARAKQISLALAGPAGPCRIQGDRAMLGRVLDNLLDNALRYTPPGGAIQVGWAQEPDGVRFWVQDSGPGLPPVPPSQLFEPLYRGDSARSTHTGGAGLGLAITKRLVEAHGGRISATDAGGARFTVTLPLPS